MKHISKILFSFLTIFLFANQLVIGQTNWNNIYYAPAVYNTGYSYHVNNSIAVDGMLYIYGDTMGSYMQSPYVVTLNPATHAVTPLSLSTYSTDYRVSSAAAISNTSTGTSYIFFGAKSQSAQYPGIYKYDVQTGVTTPEQLNTGMANNHQGIDNVVFFTNSGAASHDTLNVFANYFGSINVYRKHYNQTGFNSSASLPFYSISKSIVYRDTLYVLGEDITYVMRLYKSADGLNYTECTGFSAAHSTLISASYGFDLDTLNNSLYVLLGDNESYSYILKSDDGSSFYETQAGGYFNRYVDLKNYKNKMWMCGKSMSFSSNYNDLMVAYLSPSGSDVLSVDTLGNYHNNYGQYYHLNVVNDSLYSAGHFDFSDTTSYFSGISIYKLSLPVAGLSSPSNTTVCLFSNITYTSSSTFADSTSWFLDGTFVATSPGPNAWYGFSPSNVGTHTITLVAYGGGLTDTTNANFESFDLKAFMSYPSGTICEGVPFNLIATTVGSAGGPLTYQWFKDFSMHGSNNDTLTETPSAGTYTYYVTISDMACTTTSSITTLIINPSTNIMGIVTTGTASPVAVSGQVILYKYEPFLTKFDSVTVQPIDAAGGYTFTSATAGDYIVKAVPSASTLQITYGTSFTTWQNATTISHGCILDATKDIDVQQFATLPGFGTGTGVLTGTVIQGQGFGQKAGQNGFKPSAPGNPIGGIVVKGGRNPGGQMFTQTITGADGTYTISGLPDNTVGTDYFVQVDIPGLDTNGTYHRVITQTNSIYTNLDFVVDSMYVNPINNTVGIHDLNAIEHQLMIYPNPTTDIIHINFDLKSTSEVKIELVDIAGRIVKTLLPQTTLISEKHKQLYMLSDLNSGMYFIKLNINGKESTIKLCITN